MKRPVAAVLLLVASACSQEGRSPEEAVPAVNIARASSPPPTRAGQPTPRAAATPSKRILRPDGLDTLKIGQPVPAGDSWAERGAQIEGDCRTISSPDYPGVYAIVRDGKVRRITVGNRSDIKLAENIGVGSTEAEVRNRFGRFRASSHAYEAAPAKYLTAPKAGSGGPALRFEIGHDGKVGLMHVGTMPVLAYVEGCA